MFAFILTKAVYVKLRLLQLLSIAAVAVGVAVILETVVEITQVQIPFWYFFSKVIAVGYACFGVCANLSPLSTSKPLDYSQLSQSLRQRKTELPPE